MQAALGIQLLHFLWRNAPHGGYAFVFVFVSAASQALGTQIVVHPSPPVWVCMPVALFDVFLVVR